MFKIDCEELWGENEVKAEACVFDDGKKVLTMTGEAHSVSDDMLANDARRMQWLQLKIVAEEGELVRTLMEKYGRDGIFLTYQAQCCLSFSTKALGLL